MCEHAVCFVRGKNVRNNSPQVVGRRARKARTYVRANVFDRNDMYLNSEHHHRFLTKHHDLLPTLGGHLENFMRIKMINTHTHVCFGSSTRRPWRGGPMTRLRRTDDANIFRGLT